MLTLEQLQLNQGAFSLNADFSVASQSHVAVIGPSGAGKSTLLSIIAGFLRPSFGRVLWQGIDITDAEPSARPLSIVFQDNNLFPHLTAAQNVGLGLRPSLRLTTEELERVHDSLNRVGLHGLADRKPAALSGGQQSRVSLARTLLRARPLMLLDEPFAALGPGLKSEMLDLVAELAAATAATVLMVTHDPKDALQLGGQTILVSEGTAYPPQDTGTLFSDPPAALRAYLK